MDSSQTPIDGNHDKPHHYQNVVVMRHGDRMDNFEPLWVSTAARPWDPPLVEAGKKRAYATGLKLRTHLGFPIHRVFVSPFLRCVQTASEVVSALCALDDNPNAIDPSKVKVSIEYGLCEMLNKEAIRSESAPKDGNFGFKISELEPILPAETVDRTVEPLYKEVNLFCQISLVLVISRCYRQIIPLFTDKDCVFFSF